MAKKELQRKPRRVPTKDLVNNPAFRGRPGLGGCLESYTPPERAPGVEQLTLQEQVWRDAKGYYAMNGRLMALSRISPAQEKREDYRKFVNQLYQGLLAIETKYPFIQPQLSQQWRDSLLGKYLKRGRKG